MRFSNANTLRTAEDFDQITQYLNVLLRLFALPAFFLSLVIANIK